MKKKLLAILVAVVAVLLLPAGVALAADPLLTAHANLTQTASGTLTYLCSDGSELPFPCEYAGGTTIGMHQVGEGFAGTFDSCSGDPGAPCSTILASTIGVTQSSYIYFTGPPDASGNISFAGPVSGSFLIDRASVDTLTGSYTGTVMGTLYYDGSIVGSQASNWSATGGTGAFYGLRNSDGDFNASIGGFFPGREVASATITVNRPPSFVIGIPAGEQLGITSSAALAALLLVALRLRRRRLTA